MEQREKNLRIAAIVVAVLVIAFGCWYLLREPDVHDQRDRADDVRESLRNVGAEQRNAQSNIERIGRGIDESLRRADSVAEGIGDASERIADVQERSRECEEIVADSERRIAESKSIIQAVRSREGQDGK